MKKKYNYNSCINKHNIYNIFEGVYEYNPHWPEELLYKLKNSTLAPETKLKKWHTSYNWKLLILNDEKKLSLIERIDGLLKNSTIFPKRELDELEGVFLKMSILANNILNQELQEIQNTPDKPHNEAAELLHFLLFTSYDETSYVSPLAYEIYEEFNMAQIIYGHPVFPLGEI